MAFRDSFLKYLRRSSHDVTCFFTRRKEQEDRIKIDSSMSRLPVHDVLSTTTLWCRHICSKRKWHGTFTTIYDFPMHYRRLSASIGKMLLAATLPWYSGDQRIPLISDITYPLRIFVMFKRAFFLCSLCITIFLVFSYDKCHTGWRGIPSLYVINRVSSGCIL